MENNITQFMIWLYNEWTNNGKGQIGIKSNTFDDGFNAIVRRRFRLWVRSYKPYCPTMNKNSVLLRDCDVWKIDLK